MRPGLGFSAPLFMKNHQESPEKRVSGNRCSCHDCSCQAKEMETADSQDQQDAKSHPQSEAQAETRHPGEEGCRVESDNGSQAAEAWEDGVEQLEPEALQAEVARLQEREKELHEKFLRLKADFDNFRRRNRKELQEGITRANEELIKQLLPVLDNLDRALAVQCDVSGDSIREGVELVYRQFVDILGKEGLEPIEAVGQGFDPTIHAAAMVETVDNPELDNQVIQELQKGYSFRERVLRAAVVKVAKVN